MRSAERHHPSRRLPQIGRNGDLTAIETIC
jgi:hypothetical protein